MTSAGHDLIAILDVGKTNTKLSLVDASNSEPTYVAQKGNAPVTALSMRQLDIAGIEHWLLGQLHDFPEKRRITAIVPVAHGAACVLVDHDGQVIAAPDYEDSCFCETASEYARERSPFSETFSPRLPHGLNLGAQLHFLETRHQRVFDRAEWILPLPQYWAYRLSGVASCEVSSLGTHTDLWQPVRGAYSSLVTRRKWEKRFAPLRPATDILGPLQDDIVYATCLASTCKVYCGVHDSNASWLAHLKEVRRGADLTVISSGTWTIAMKSGGDLARLQETRDMLANVDVFGSPVATARFMGGREFEMIAGATPGTATIADLERVIAVGAMALPSFTESGGPFPGRVGRIIDGLGLSAGERTALAGLYVALVTDVLLELLGPSEYIVIDGPFAANPLYVCILKALRPRSYVSVSNLVSDTSAGALALVLGDAMPARSTANLSVEAPPVKGLVEYRDAWRICIA